MLFVRLASYMRRSETLRYICKGVDPRAFGYVGNERHTFVNSLGFDPMADSKQGLIAVKRCGVSQNLGPQARLEHYWREVRDLAALNRALHEPYFALLQLQPPPGPPHDPSLSPYERLRMQFRDPYYLHGRRLGLARSAAQPRSDDWPWHLATFSPVGP
jgi:hypothetical protein